MESPKEVSNDTRRMMKTRPSHRRPRRGTDDAYGRLLGASALVAAGYLLRDRFGPLGASVGRATDRIRGERGPGAGADRIEIRGGESDERLARRVSDLERRMDADSGTPGRGWLVGVSAFAAGYAFRDRFGSLGERLVGAPGRVRRGTGGMTRRLAGRTDEVTHRVAERTDEVAARAAARVRRGGRTVAERTGEATEVTVDRIERAGEEASDRLETASEEAGDRIEKTGEEASDRIDDQDENSRDRASDATRRRAK